MAWLDNIRNAMHPYDDDYIENEERAAEEEFADQQDDIPADDAVEDKQPRPVFSRREPKPQPSYSAPAQEKQKMKLKFVHPEQFDEAAEIADSLRAHQAVLMNLEMTETDTARRLLDFFVRRGICSGRQGHARFRAGVYNRADQCRSRRRCGRRF